MIEKRDFVKEPLQVLSYGGGVQSTAMIFLIKEGKLPKPDIVIHSDTGSEMPYTEEMVLRISKIVEEMGIPFEIVNSKHGKLHEHYLSKKIIPVVGVRSCTDNFKVLPQRRKIREIVGSGNGKLLAECWLGITTDESRRKIDSELKWIGNKFPLLDLDISRQDCIKINKKNGFQVKKSGCFLCPYHGKKWFVRLFQDFPDLFEKCEELEREFQKNNSYQAGLVPSILDIRNLKINSIFSFGHEKIGINESSCDSGGCFL